MHAVGFFIPTLFTTKGKQKQLPRFLLFCLVPFLLLLSLVLRLAMSLRRFICRVIMSLIRFFPCLVVSFSSFLRLSTSPEFVRSSFALLHECGVDIARRGLTGIEKAIIYVRCETGVTAQ